MAQREPLPIHRLPSTEISPSVEETIERTWPSADDLSPPAETPDEVHARVRGFFVEVFDNNRKLQKITRARIAQAQAQAQTQAFLKSQALIAQPPPPAQPQPAPKPKPKRQKAGLSPLEILGITAASVGAVVLIGKAVSAYSESKRPRRRLALGQADDDDTDETSTIIFNHTTHSTLIDAAAIEAMAPKLQSFVSEAVSKNFDEGKAVQHVHQHQHTQYVHPVTKTERIVERSVPGPKGDPGGKGDKGNKGDPGKSTRGPRGHQGKKGKPGTVKRVTKTRTRTVPLRGAQPKTSKGLFDD